jgi:hypothetical protein
MARGLGHGKEVGMLWLGFILIGVGGLCWFFSGRSATKAVQMKATDTSKIADLKTLVDEIRGDLGGSDTGFAQYAELKGKAVSDDPVVGELSGKPAAICDTRIERQIETQTQVKDQQGNWTTRWEKSTDTLSSNRRTAVFHLDDGTARLRVDPTGADLELETVVDRFEPPSAVESAGMGQIAVRLGSFSLSVGSGFGNDRRTLGYRFVERILPLARDLYVLGEVTDTPDGLLLRKPSGSGKPFVLSTKSEAELTRTAESSARWLKIAAMAFGIGGIGLAVMGLIR